MLIQCEEKPHCIHALGAVEKPYRDIPPITDCGRPDDECINANTDSLVQKFRYKSVNNVVDILQKGDYMSVIDIRNTYWSVPINPEHSRYQGFKWNLDGADRYFMDGFVLASSADLIISIYFRNLYSGPALYYLESNW